MQLGFEDDVFTYLLNDLVLSLVRLRLEYKALKLKYRNYADMLNCLKTDAKIDKVAIYDYVANGLHSEMDNIISYNHSWLKCMTNTYNQNYQILYFDGVEEFIKPDTMEDIANASTDIVPETLLIYKKLYNKPDIDILINDITTIAEVLNSIVTLLESIGKITLAAIEMKGSKKQKAFAETVKSNLIW